MHLLIDAFKCHSRACLAISIIKIECVVENGEWIFLLFYTKIFFFYYHVFSICERLEKMNDDNEWLERCFYCLLKIMLWVWLVEWNNKKNKKSENILKSWSNDDYILFEWMMVCVMLNQIPLSSLWNFQSIKVISIYNKNKKKIPNLCWL